jgi:FKBP-type peptidyl-prolyl cis-trans isomerase 2
MMQRVAHVGLLVAVATVAAELKVTQYAGPTECDDAEKVKKGDQLGMHYTGTIDESSKTGTPGKKFDSSRDRGDVFNTKIGVGQVIKGWDEGLIGLCKGAKATLVIPPEMGYGESGAGGDIPGGATLNFDVEVMSIDEAPPEPNLFVELDTDKDKKLTKEEVLVYFKKQGQDSLPEGLWDGEDKDKDGTISWDEFGGPKGSAPPEYKDEL